MVNLGKQQFHPFSKAAVEKAAKAAYESWIEFDNWRAEKESNSIYARPSWEVLDDTSKLRWVDAIDPAISAAFVRALWEGNVANAKAVWKLDGSVMAATGISGEGYISVTIIKDAAE